MKWGTLLLVLLALPVVAQDSPARDMGRVLASGLFRCELQSALYDQSENLWGLAEPDVSDELTQCLIDAEAKAKAAYAQFSASNPSAPVKEDAKAAYAAWLAYSRVLVRGMDLRSQKATIEHADLARAEASFRIEAGL